MPPDRNVEVSWPSRKNIRCGLECGSHQVTAAKMQLNLINRTSKGHYGLEMIAAEMKVENVKT